MAPNYTKSQGWAASGIALLLRNRLGPVKCPLSLNIYELLFSIKKKDHCVKIKLNQNKSAGQNQTLSNRNNIYFNKINTNTRYSLPTLLYRLEEYR